MSYTAIYTHAWAPAETGPGAAIDEFLELDLDTVTIAGSYHAGKCRRTGGDDELAFYNYGHLRQANLAWVGEALRGQA